VYRTLANASNRAGRIPVHLFTTIILVLTGLLIAPTVIQAATGGSLVHDLTRTSVGYTALLVFFIAYLVVMAEEFTHLRKSKPVILAAGIIWGMIAFVYTGHGDSHMVESALRENLVEFSELFLFLLSAMTYVNAMDERLLFEALRSWLVRKGFVATAACSG
jgi:hypothetical protein